MTKPEEILQENVQALPKRVLHAELPQQHLHKAPDPPLGVNLFLFRARGVWLCKRKPADLGLALGPAFPL